MFEFRAHGANPGKLYESLGIAMPVGVIDFSTNTNALPWDGVPDLDMRGLLTDYPDDETALLRECLAEKNDCSPEEILVTNGSNEAIYLLASYCAGGGVNRVLQPSYGEYQRALSAWGAKVGDIFSLGELERGASTLWICNPCNPTGVWTEAETISEALRRYPDTDFIIDEAYIDFLTVEGQGLCFSDYPNLVVLRSLTKIYHLCGARAGYVLANRGIIQKLKRRQPTWSVNSIAQMVALACLRDENYRRLTREFYCSATPRFMRNIRAAGFNTLPTSVNFFLVETDDDERLIRFLLQRGLVVRHTRNFAGLDGRYVRIATRLPQENALLTAALVEFRS